MYKTNCVFFVGNLLLICAFLQACAVPPPEQSCEDACQDLFMECGFEAFPDRSSCTMGCMYEAEQGAQIATLQECVKEADCNIFSVIECQNAFGAKP